MNPLDHRCPTCGANPGHPCRTRRTGRVTGTHQPRWDIPYLAAARRPS
jgi:hypothetical protein